MTVFSSARAGVLFVDSKGPTLNLSKPIVRVRSNSFRLPRTMLLRSYSACLLAFLGLASIYFLFTSTSAWHHATSKLAARAPANATLGFGAIYAISGHRSPRRHNLIQAANVTGLEIHIPKVPKWTQEDMNDFKSGDGLISGSIRDGSLKAWMSHAVALNAFLNTNQETALFIEDDVDWDIRLRTKQIPAAAAAQRSLLPRAPIRHYWGKPSDWDLLYLGHCGDYFGSVDGLHVGVGVLHPSDLESIPHAIFKDPTLPDPSELHPFTIATLSAFNLPPKTRMVHKSKWPLCTFGYAVTRHMAEQILDSFNTSSTEPHAAKAYDIAILAACRDSGYRCYTVNPERFHHMPGTSMIDGVAADAAAMPPADRVGAEQVRYRKETSNIGCGFWGSDFHWEGDFERLAYLREEVGRKGRCLKPGRLDDGSRLSARRGRLRRV